MQRLEGHHHLNRGAVGIGDDPPVPEYVRPVYFRDDERDSGIKAECAAVVDNERPGPDRVRREFPAYRGPRGEQGDFHAGERSGGELKNRHLFVCKGDGLPDGARGCQEPQLPDGKAVFLEDLRHFSSDKAGCPDHGDSVAFHLFMPR